MSPGVEMYAVQSKDASRGTSYNKTTARVLGHPCNTKMSQKDRKKNRRVC
jgi:hypothetical protein